MALSDTHPAYTARLPDWIVMGDCYEGERAVKEKTDEYLPATANMITDGYGTSGSPGQNAYDAYLARAVFPSDVSDSVEANIGVAHRKPPGVAVPTAMEPLLKALTVDRADMETLLRRINEAQLTFGRCGLLVDVPTGKGADAMPYVCKYGATAILNWSTYQPEGGNERLELVVLDESGMVQDNELVWKEQKQYRVLALAERMIERGLLDGAQLRGVTTGYVVGVTTNSTTLQSCEWTQPVLRGKALEEIPFTFVNVQDLSDCPDKPPLLGLAQTCLAIYRGEADRRQALFMQGQETLVLTGVDEDNDPEKESAPKRVGAGAMISLPAGGDAKYVGVGASGLAEMREALAEDRQLAAQKGMRLHDATEGASGQSGDALGIRVAARTASLVGLVRAGGAALQRALGHCAMFLGMDPEAVVVEPNIDFAEDMMTGEELGQWAAAKRMGAPVSWQTIYDIMLNRGVATRTWEEEQALIDDEEPASGTGMDPNDPNQQDQNANGAEDQNQNDPPVN